MITTNRTFFMATQAVSDSLFVNVEAAATELTQDIMLRYAEVRELSSMNETIRENLGQETCGKTKDLADRVNSLSERIVKCELSMGSELISSVDGLARQLLTTQFNALIEEFQALKLNVSYTIKDVSSYACNEIQKLQLVLNKTVGQYLQTRSVEDSDTANTYLHDLEVINRDVVELKNVQDVWAGKQVDKYPYLENPLDAWIGKLRRLVGSDYYFHVPMEIIFIKLDRIAAGEDVPSLDDRWGINKKKIDEFIDELHQQVGSDQVNYWVSKLSGEKSGDKYGQLHRYDDLGILKEAILRTAKFLAGKIMEKEAADLEPEAVYAKLFEILGRPEVENSMGWMKRNACYYTRELHQAINEVK